MRGTQAQKRTYINDGRNLKKHWDIVSIIIVIVFIVTVLTINEALTPFLLNLLFFKKKLVFIIIKII